MAQYVCSHLVDAAEILGRPHPGAPRIRMTVKWVAIRFQESWYIDFGGPEDWHDFLWQYIRDAYPFITEDSDYAQGILKQPLGPGAAISVMRLGGCEDLAAYIAESVLLAQTMEDRK